MLLVHPALLEVIGVEITRPAGAVEIRGFYGGLELGLGIFFAIALARRSWWRPALLVQVLALGGAAVGRLVGILVDGGGEWLVLALMAAEAGAALVGLAALRALRQGARAGGRAWSE